MFCRRNSSEQFVLDFLIHCRNRRRKTTKKKKSGRGRRKKNNNKEGRENSSFRKEPTKESIL